MRTKYQRIAETTSDDGGQTWSPVRLNDLVSSNAEMYLARIPSTGDLLCVWNQATTREIETGFLSRQAHSGCIDGQRSDVGALSYTS